MAKLEFRESNLSQPPRAEAPARRMVYNGDATAPPHGAKSNKPVHRKDRLPMTLMTIIIAVTLSIVIYIWNKIEVGQLTSEVNDLENHYQKIVSANEILKAEINQKSRLERISSIAANQLTLVYPKEQPVWFELDPERLEQIRQD